MFCIYVSNKLARRLIDFYFARTTSALNKGTQEGGLGHGAYGCRQTMAVHPVAEGVSSLEIEWHFGRAVLPAILFSLKGLR